MAAKNDDARTDDEILELYGAHYWPAGSNEVWTSPDDEQYHYECHIGEQEIDVEAGDSVWFLTEDSPGSDDGAWTAHVLAGPLRGLESSHFAVVVRGYKAVAQSRAFGKKGMVLPYVNGCSTDQIFPPRRLGDPTLQHLLIPAYSAEQAHHIHSTVRAVFVLRGKGVSIVGMEGVSVTTELLPGMVCILDPMCPHHFETPQGEAIEVIPFHVFSSTPGETNHPMFRGTFLMNQGA